MILFGVVCILNTMTIGCGSATETAVKTEETQSDEIMSEDGTDVPLNDNNGNTEESRKIKGEY